MRKMNTKISIATDDSSAGSCLMALRTGYVHPQMSRFFTVMIEDVLAGSDDL